MRPYSAARAALISLLFVGVSCSGEREPCTEGSDGFRVELGEALSTCNHAPEAAITGRRQANKGEAIVLDASLSRDLDGDPISLTWSLEEGAGLATLTSSGAKAWFQAPLSGVFGVKVVASDGELEGSAVHEVVVGNVAPRAVASHPVRVELGETVTLDGRASSDPEGSAVTLSWALLERPNGSTAMLATGAPGVAVFVADVAGRYLARLTVVDDEGATSTADAPVAAGMVGEPPVARVGSAVSVRVGGSIELDGRRSTDPDGDALVYTWTLQSPPLSLTSLSDPAEESPRFNVDVPGTYVASLTVFDGVFESSVVTQTVEASRAPSGPDVFDPSEVYYLGRLRMEMGPGNCGARAIIAPESPSAVRAGFDCDALVRSIRSSDATLLYSSTTDGVIRAFSRDDYVTGAYPTDPRANDRTVYDSGCSGSSMVFTTDEAQTWFLCSGSVGWQSSEGGSISTSRVGLEPSFRGDSVLFVGQDGVYVSSLDGMHEVRAIELPNEPAFSLARRDPNSEGWWVALRESSGDATRLYRVRGHGTAERMGDYPSLPSSSSIAMDGTGRLYLTGSSANGASVSRASPGAGSLETIYETGRNMTFLADATDGVLLTGN